MRNQLLKIEKAKFTNQSIMNYSQFFLALSLCVYSVNGQWQLDSSEEAPDSSSQELSSNSDFASAALEATNSYRAKHGADPLTLNAQLSGDAQAWADKLARSGQLRHSCSVCTEYVENLWMMSGKVLSPEDSAKKAVKDWYNEVSLYNWNYPAYSSSTGHFTALVWKGTKEMGIGLASNKARRRTYVVARYAQPGNTEGAFKQNVGAPQ